VRGVDNISLIWKATSNLTDKFHIWSNPKKNEYKGWIFVPVYICSELLRKICSMKEFPIELKILNEDFEKLDGKETCSILDQVKADDKEILNLIEQLFIRTKNQLKKHETIYQWNLLENWLFELKSQDFSNTSEEIVSRIQRDLIIKSRVCPNPQAWDGLFEYINSRIAITEDEKFPPPLILAAWNFTSDEEKFERFHEQLRIVADKGYIRQIKVIMDNYAEDDWHHFGE
jgi:hypothetical protein